MEARKPRKHRKRSIVDVFVFTQIKWLGCPALETTPLTCLHVTRESTNNEQRPASSVSVTARCLWLKYKTMNLERCNPGIACFVASDTANYYSNRLFSVMSGALIFWPLTARLLLVPLER